MPTIDAWRWMPRLRRAGLRRRWWPVAVLMAMGAFHAAAQEQEIAPADVPDVAMAEEATPPVAADAGAQLFAQKCTGCHTIGGGALSGPDLKPVVARPQADVEQAVKRMEKSVGPLSGEEVSLLAGLLLSPDASERVKSEQQRVALQHVAKLAPASAKAGEALFHGTRPFQAGGLACAACHEVGRGGGSLALSLRGSFQRLGQASLMSVCENPSFPLMRAVYEERPISKQEALHVVKYLETADQQASAAAGAGMLGWGTLLGVVAALAGIGFGHRGRPKESTRARLVRETAAGARRNVGATGSGS